MALLQISEPGLSAAPHQRRLAVGIDLGTTNSLVATVRSGQAETLADEQGRHLLPSVVHYQQQGHAVGYDARANAARDPANTISSVKRMMGRSLADIQTRYPHLPYQLQASENGLPMIATEAGLLNPIRVSSDILKALAARATATLGGDLDGVVITVPAYFDDAQRQGTKDAARLAGLHVLRLLNEPTAAAIAYGLDSGQEGVIAVYDLGGGTFDISILRLSRGVFEVLATGGDSALGGDDFDHLLADYIREQAGIADRSDARVQRELLDAAIDAKIALSDAQTVTVNVAGWQGEISRDQFNDLIAPLVKRTLLACRRALKDAGVEADEVLEVVMVGGSTRVPLVRERVGEFFGRTPLTAIRGNAEMLTDPDLPPSLHDKFCDIIVNESERLSRLTHDLLTLQRIENSPIPEEMQRVNLRELASNVVDALHPILQDRQANALVTGEAPDVLGNPDSLRQAITNLVENASRFIQPGGHITVELAGVNGNSVVAVKDDGCGFGDVDPKLLFDRFYRTDASRTRGTGGTGLGLAIVKSIAEAHDGTVEALNLPEGGACFMIAIPSIPADISEKKVTRK